MTIQAQPRPTPDAPAIIEVPLIEAPGFLTDWLSDHRSLAEGLRIETGKYITAIVNLHVAIGRTESEQVGAEATGLWQTWRTFYDDLRGIYGRSDHEDFGKAMRRL